ncbi:unnamed protein product [Ostreobium quekettii]|uniref:Mitochondrial ATP synthase regulatory component factor B n=1 Tax=Ostreobium quekettii TaxID=121088 RepID=A0A8S1J5S4_9CHLO|nr:unnamed protein product [Ostreobium quekettii]
MFPHVLDRVHAVQAEHEAIVFLQRGRLVDRHWCQWATQATKESLLMAGDHLQEKIEHTVNRFSALESIKLTGASANNVALLRRLPLLRHATIWHASCDMMHLGQLVGLVSLKLAWCHKLTDQGVGVIATLTRLTALELSNCWDITEHCVSSLALLPALRDLNVSNTRCMSDVGMGHFAAMSTLTKIDFYHSGQTSPLSDKGAKMLGTMTNLVALNLADTPSFTSRGVAHILSLTNLADLCLPINASDDTLHSLACLTGISHLGIDGNKVAERGWKSLKQFSKLSALSIHDCETLDKGMKFIGEVTNLISLTLGEIVVRKFDEHALISLSHLTALTSLSMCNISGLTDKHADGLSNMATLKRLHLTNCENISGQGFGYLSGLKCLTDLHLSNCLCITDSSLGELATVRSLTDLHLEDCPEVTDAGVAALSQLTALSILNLRGFPKITKVGLAQLESLRLLRRLRVVGRPEVALKVGEFLSTWH